MKNLIQTSRILETILASLEICFMRTRWWHWRHCRLALEDHVEHGQAVLLRGAGQVVQAPHGEVPGLQVGGLHLLALQIFCYEDVVVREVPRLKWGGWNELVLRLSWCWSPPGIDPGRKGLVLWTVSIWIFLFEMFPKSTWFPPL